MFQLLGLPGANGQKWFVFHVSRPDESDEEAQFITVRAIVDTSKVTGCLLLVLRCHTPPPASVGAKVTV